MSSRLAEDVAAFLSVHGTYRSLKRLPDEFLERSRLLSGETVIQVGLDLRAREDQGNRWAAVTLLQPHPRALRLLRWRPLQEVGDGMGNWGTRTPLLSWPGWRGEMGGSAIRECIDGLARRTDGGVGQPSSAPLF